MRKILDQHRRSDPPFPSKLALRLGNLGQGDDSQGHLEIDPSKVVKEAYERGMCHFSRCAEQVPPGSELTCPFLGTEQESPVVKNLVPKIQTSHFLGRDSIFSEIEEYFDPFGYPGRKAAIWGMGGVG